MGRRYDVRPVLRGNSTLMENAMRYLLMLVVGAIGLGFIGSSTVRAEDEKEVKVKGVLIDQHCGPTMMDKDDPQAAAAEHKKACCEKCAKEHGLAVISGKKMYKLDDAGKEKAMAYLKDHDNMNVVVE